jgi:hypothetical protein
MFRFQPFRSTALLALAIGLAPGAASAQEADTLTISSTFYMDWLHGTVGPDLAEVFANRHEHTWTLTLHGTSHSHSVYSSSSFGYIYLVTEIHATSFDLEFSGPDAATLNGIVSEHIAGGDLVIYLENAYSSGFGDDFATMYVWPMGHDMDFFSGTDMGVFTLFPADADGYPVVGPEPFSIENEYSVLSDLRPGYSGSIESRYTLVTFEGGMGALDQGEPVVLAVADAFVSEGNRGTTTLLMSVTLSRASNQPVTVNYQTADGTALVSNRDYVRTSGTLTFQPGETFKTISISIAGDRKREPNETFTVQLSNAVGATLSDGVGTATIVNDD